MKRVILDEQNASLVTMTNDAFYWLFMGEEPLDEIALDEAAKIQAQYPNGYEIDEDYDVLENGLIACTITPYNVIECAYTHHIPFFNTWELEYAIDGENVSMRFFSPTFGERDKADVALQHSKYGYDFIVTPKGSRIPLNKGIPF